MNDSIAYYYNMSTNGTHASWTLITYNGGGGVKVSNESASSWGSNSNDDISGMLAFMLIPIFVAFVLFLIVLPLVNIYRRRRYEEMSPEERRLYNTRSSRPSQPKKLYSRSFKKNKFRDFCGVEIECIRGNYFNHAKYHFKDVYDSSLNVGGREYVGMPSNGDRLFRIIDDFCKRLQKEKYSVDKSCGLHIHLGIKEEIEIIKKLYIFYSKYEDFFFKMLPKSRQKRSYCERIRETDNFSAKDVLKMENLDEFKKLYYETNFYNRQLDSKYHDKRYCWTNFHSLFYRGTLEIRNHAGTISEEKIKQWITIHLALLNYLRKKSASEINALGKNKEEFLKVFPKATQSYIQMRWDKFNKRRTEE